MSEEELKTRKEEHERIANESSIDLDNLPKQTHVWVDRGLVMSCEGAGHPNHRHFKIQKSMS